MVTTDWLQIIIPRSGWQYGCLRGVFSESYFWRRVVVPSVMGATEDAL